MNYNNVEGNEEIIWICKPTDLSRGRGITIINKMEELKYDQQSVLQKYLKNPLLIRGHKWDLRIYALIPQGMRPMNLYLYKEGLVRFSTERYSNRNLNNLFSHLTNSSINKYAHGAGQDGQSVHDNKWTLDQLRNYFLGSGLDFDLLWLKIEKIIVLTCINLCPTCPNYDNCFELLGFDIIVDDKLKPWLLEVNSSPAMAMDGVADRKVKPDLLKETFQMINFMPFEVFQSQQSQKQTQQKQSLYPYKQAKTSASILNSMQNRLSEIEPGRGLNEQLKEQSFFDRRNHNQRTALSQAKAPQGLKDKSSFEESEGIIQRKTKNLHLQDHKEPNLAYYGKKAKKIDTSLP